MSKARTEYLDFGDHIEGSRHDSRVKVALSYDDVRDLDTDEQWKQMIKDNIWPKPRLGLKDRFVEYCTDKLRSTVRKQAKEKSKLSIKLYQKELTRLKELAEQCETEEQIRKVINLFNSKYFKHIFYRKVNMSSLNREAMEKAHFGINKKDIPRIEAEKEILLLPINRKNCDVDGNRCFYFMNRRNFVFKVESDFDESFLDSDNKMLVVNNRVVNFTATPDDYEEAIESFIEDYNKENKRRMANRIQLGHLDVCSREGEDYRKGATLVAEDLQKTFGFYGGQFGRWLMYNERSELVNMAYDALCDLAEALNVSASDISYQGELGIAFGARGTGYQRAFYELDNKVISLTRVLGSGHLAEEWFHSLDHHLSVINGVSTDYYSRHMGKYQSFNKLLAKVMNIRTKFRVESINIDNYEERRTPKWELPENMLARAFTSYVVDKLKEKGKYNDFLAYEFKDIKAVDGRVFSLYPSGEERKEFNQLFDQLFEELRSEGVFEPFRESDVEK